MDRPERVILTNMCMICNGTKVLVENKKWNDIQGIIFPGGHVEEHEPIVDSVIREIKEETGIDLEVEEGPYMSIVTYDHDYFGTGKKTLNSIYYYRFFTDEEPNCEETMYDDLELETDFNLFYIDFATFDSFIEKSIEEGSIDEAIGREMLYVFSEYKEMFGGEV